jgi:transposase-like protein
MTILSRPEFYDELKAIDYLERIVWRDGRVCPRCGAVDRIRRQKANPAKKIRLGLWRCSRCENTFTVKVGTVFKYLSMPLHRVLQAIYLMANAKGGVTPSQLHRILEITHQGAWNFAHRIREALQPDMATRNLLSLKLGRGTASSFMGGMVSGQTQSEKFRDAVRELECDEDEARWDELLRKVAKQRPGDLVRR